MSSQRARLASAWLILALVLGLSSIRDPPEATALGTMPMRTSDPLLGPPRGEPEMVIDFAERVGSVRMADVRAYVYEIFRLAPIVGLDPAIMIGQSALEMNYWRDPYWRDHLNAAGIGIFHSGAPSFTWNNGTDAARGHIFHLYVYAAGVPSPNHILYQYRNLTPSISGILSKGYAGTTHTIAQLEGRWALMSQYAQGLVNKGNEILGTWKPPTPTPTPTAPPRDVASSVASDGNDPGRAYDQNLGTSWAILGAGTIPSGGHITFDLGGPIDLRTVRWVFRVSGYADHLRIRTSLDGGSFTTIKFTGNAPAKVWQSLNTNVTARYVRFHFLNPNGDPDLGYLAEVAFAGELATLSSPTATSTPQPTATATLAPQPKLSGSKLKPTGSGGSSGVTPTGRAWDGNYFTDWRTTTSPPPQSAFVYFDLGGQASLTGARWLLSETGCGATLAIAGSNDKHAWTNYASFATSYSGIWLATPFSGTARYVRFQFLNPGSAAALGCLAEAEVWGTGVTAAELGSPTAAPTATATASPEETASPSPESTPTVILDLTSTATFAPPEATPTDTPEPTMTLEPPTIAPEPPTPTEVVVVEPTPTSVVLTEPPPTAEPNG